MTQSLPISSERRRQIEQTCLRLLARREHSGRELQDKLAVKGFSNDEVAPVIAVLAEKNWQNDQRFATCLCRHRIENGYGPIRIRYELQQHGVVAFDIDSLADELTGGWLNALLDVYNRKYGEEKDISQNEWLKRCRFMQQRGFSTELIRTLFATLKIKLFRLKKSL